MATVLFVTGAKSLCDWCGRDCGDHPVPVTIVTSRGAFHEEICEDCRVAFAVDDDAD